MKQLYRKMIHCFSGLTCWIEVKKILFVEIIGIFQKRKLYKDIQWSKEQQEHFDDYWKRIYGKKISNRWHKLYQSINGEYCVDYVPSILFSTKLEPKINSYQYCKVLSDKNLLEVLYSDKIEAVRTPATYLFSVDDKYFNQKREQVLSDKVSEILYDIGEAVIKPTTDTSSGDGVRIVNFKKGTDECSKESVAEILKSYKTNFIVQERIVPHESFKNLYPHSINTLRIITYRIDGDIKITPVCLRIGSGGSDVDNIHAGGMVVGVNDDGKCLEKAYVLGNFDNKKTYINHPDTGIVFENYEIPQFNRFLSVAENLHTATANIDIISWDMTLNRDGEIIIIEANYWGQSSWFPQIVHQCGLFGNDTEKIMKHIKNSR